MHLPFHCASNPINRLLASGSSWSVVQQTIGCSRSTISKAVRHATLNARPSVSGTPAPAKLSAGVILRFHVENGSKFTRGKTKVRRDIDYLVRATYKGLKLNEAEYRIPIQYESDTDLKTQLNELVDEIHHEADLRNCVVDDVLIKNEDTGRYWRDYDGGWEPEEED